MNYFSFPSSWHFPLHEFFFGFFPTPPPPITFLMVRPLAIPTRRNKDIQGIIVGEEEIKLGLFADDLTAFLRNDKSLTVFLDLVENFGKCSGLIINHEKSNNIFGQCYLPFA